MTRRELLFSFPALAMIPTALAQTAKPTIPVKGLNQFTLLVSDVKRSVDFYQGLFGMPIQARQGSIVILRIGNGPQFIAIGPSGTNPPSIAPRVGMTMENFNADRVAGILAQHGITARKDGTAEVVFDDPDGLVLRLMDTKYCGGAGTLGEVCAKVEPSPKKGLIALSDMNHFTINTSNGTRSNEFYQQLFGLPIRSRQGAALGLGIGPGKMFVMFAGGGGGRGAANATPRPASINHVCMNMEKFVPDDVIRILTSFGLTAREGQGAAGPMKHYVTLRMENRGGAPGGTPELYFTDPDGLLIQLQDVSYCGGSGFLGNVCEA